MHLAKEINNAERYHFSDFTHSNYRLILQLAKEKGYVFRQYNDFNRDEKFILLRHDIDLSVEAARQIAEIEAGEGIKSTYFLHLHSIFYSYSEKEITRCTKKILDLGHALGLHFDTHYYDIGNENVLKNYMSWEKEILEKLFSREISVFSFHNTTPFTMQCNAWKYASMINTYAEYFQQEVLYCSDSYGYWRFKRLEEVLLETPKRMQILTHPGLWTEKIMSPIERVYHCINERCERNKTYYTNLLSKNRMNVIDWEEQ